MAYLFTNTKRISNVTGYLAHSNNFRLKDPNDSILCHFHYYAKAAANIEDP
jgi:hypothetical protein